MIVRCLCHGASNGFHANAIHLQGLCFPAEIVPFRCMMPPTTFERNCGVRSDIQIVAESEPARFQAAADGGFSFEGPMGLSEHREEVRPQISSEQQEQEEERRKLRRLQVMRSEEHTSELQSLRHLVCRLLLEKRQRKD